MAAGRDVVVVARDDGRRRRDAEVPVDERAAAAPEEDDVKDRRREKAVVRGDVWLQRDRHDDAREDNQQRKDADGDDAEQDEGGDAVHFQGLPQLIALGACGDILAIEVLGDEDLDGLGLGSQSDADVGELLALVHLRDLGRDIDGSLALVDRSKLVVDNTVAIAPVAGDGLQLLGDGKEE